MKPNQYLLILTCAILSAFILPSLGVPSPPMQGKPWEMPKSMKDKDGAIEKAVNELFKPGLGYADPRGCAYHHVELTYGTTIQKGRGWLLPVEKDNPQLYAIGWSGLVYPVTKVGEKADLQKDIAGGKFQEGFIHDFISSEEPDSFENLPPLSFMNSSGAAPFLLLRLGIAVKVVKDNDDPFDGRDERTVGVVNDPDVLEHILSLALTARADGVEAFYAKNFPLATSRLELYDRLWKKLTDHYAAIRAKIDPAKLKAHLLKLEDPQDDPFGGLSADIPDILFPPEQNPYWRSILVDAKRRCSLPDARNLSPLEKLIDSWDTIDAWDNNYDVPPESVSQVIGYGTAAIEPLLECMKNDKRWTLYRFYQDHDGDGNDDLNRKNYSFAGDPIYVPSIAIYALQKIFMFEIDEYVLHRSPVRNYDDPDYEKVAKEILAFCKKYENAQGAELWYKILKDQNAEIDYQLEAVELIVRPSDTMDYYYSGIEFFSYDMIKDHYGEATSSREGQKLRGIKDPSVTELIIKAYHRERKLVDEKIAAGEDTLLNGGNIFPGHMPYSIYTNSIFFVRYLEEWQPGNITLLRSHYQWLSKSVDPKKYQPYIEDYCKEAIIYRIWSKDETAMQDYQQHVLTTARLTMMDCQFLDHYSKYANMDKIVELLFLNFKSTSCLSHPEGLINFQGYPIEDYRFKFLKFPSYRKALIQALKSKEIRAKLHETKEESYYTFIPKPENPPYISDETKAAPIIKTTDIRLCDFIIHELVKSDNEHKWLAPAFELNATVEKRDEAVQQWIKLLDR